MKISTGVLKKTILLGFILLGIVSQGFAQWDMRKLNLIVDWQMNAPLSAQVKSSVL